MSSAGSQFAIDISEMVARSSARVEDVVRKVTFEVFKAVVLRSPVDTGRFRSNWNFSIGAPDYSTSTGVDASRGDAQASRALTAPVGGVLWLGNGLPYARRLENGYSQQAPQGMVRITASEFSAHVREGLKAASP